MLLNLKKKIGFTVALTDAAWETQRQAYVRQSPSLNAEFARFKNFGGSAQTATAAVDYTLPARMKADEVVRLPRGYNCLRVYSGRAWISYKGVDHLLSSGDEIIFDGGSQDAVVSSAGSVTLNFRIMQ